MFYDYMLDLNVVHKIISKMYYPGISSYDLEEVVSVFDTYFAMYKEHKGIDHPPLCKEQIANIMRKLDHIEGITGRIDPEDYDLLIQDYFDQTTLNTDFNINHFFSGDIRYNRFINCFDPGEE